MKLPGLRFQIEGKASASPIADNDTDAGRHANRRVTVTFAAPGGLTVGTTSRSKTGGSFTSRGDGTALLKAAEQVSRALLGDGGEASAVGSARGSVDTYSDSARMQPAVAEIVARGDRRLRHPLRWRLKSTGELLTLRAFTFSPSAQPASGPTEVALVNLATKELAGPSASAPDSSAFRASARTHRTRWMRPARS